MVAPAVERILCQAAATLYVELAPDEFNALHVTDTPLKKSGVLDYLRFLCGDFEGVHVPTTSTAVSPLPKLLNVFNEKSSARTKVNVMFWDASDTGCMVNSISLLETSAKLDDVLLVFVNAGSALTALAKHNANNPRCRIMFNISTDSRNASILGGVAFFRISSLHIPFTLRVMECLGRSGRHDELRDLDVCRWTLQDGALLRTALLPALAHGFPNQTSLPLTLVMMHLRLSGYDFKVSGVGVGGWGVGGAMVFSVRRPRCFA